jgi:hypothetical protein
MILDENLKTFLNKKIDFQPLIDWSYIPNAFQKTLLYRAN